MSESFEQLLAGGHPNSLGRTLEVVALVLADKRRLEPLYRCYFSADEVVRLRTSNALKRVSREQPQWLVPYIDKLIGEVGNIEQASAQWTLANLLQTLTPFMDTAQKTGALKLMQRNLAQHSDWIVLNNTMQTLAAWAIEDEALRQWLLPHLERLSGDSRKSVAKKAVKFAAALAKSAP
ncbi:MAG: hypothetical protein GKR94_06895 [Gammaproteobacteria bacterium]|nr:hypothetical protein [Gammaproteobacteria bacterium]